MTVLFERRLIWITRGFRTKRLATSLRRHTAGAGAQAYDDLGRISVGLLTLQWAAGTDLFAVQFLTLRGAVT
jgi:hypothetical protein